jgi:hypothetical protein
LHQGPHISISKPKGKFTMSNVIFNDERNLAALKKRKDTLQNELSNARAEAESAIAKRRAWLLTGDVSDSKARKQVDDAVINAQAHEAAVGDALDELNKKIAEAQQQIALERNKAERDKACAELSAIVNTLQAAIDAYTKAGAGLIDAIKPLASLPGVDPTFFDKMQGVVPEIAAAAAQLAGDVQAYSRRIASGLTPPPGAPRVEPPKPAALPHIAKIDVLLLQDSRWQEHGATMTGAKYSTAAVPVAIAERAIKAGLAHPLDSPIAARLIEQHGVRRAAVIAIECSDLEHDEPPYTGPKIEGDAGEPVPVIGKPVTGIASISAA